MRQAKSTRTFLKSTSDRRRVIPSGFRTRERVGESYHCKEPVDADVVVDKSKDRVTRPRSFQWLAHHDLDGRCRDFVLPDAAIHSAAQAYDHHPEISFFPGEPGATHVRTDIVSLRNRKNSGLVAVGLWRVWMGAHGGRCIERGHPSRWGQATRSRGGSARDRGLSTTTSASTGSRGRSAGPFHSRQRA
jgi:hypothetical protein